MARLGFLPGEESQGFFLDNYRALISSGLSGISAGIGIQAGRAQAQTIRRGADIITQGAMLTASGLRTSAESVKKEAASNIEVAKVNEYRRLQSISRQFQRTLGRQTVQAAKSGIAVGSKSFMQLRNETSNIFKRTILDLKTDTEDAIQNRLFESRIKQANLENQARAFEFKATNERYLANIQAQNVESQTKTRGLGTLLGSVTNLLPSLITPKIPTIIK